MKNTFWFKRRRYGWGWVPVTWQGWVTVMLFIVGMIAGTLIVKDTPEGTLDGSVIAYMLYVFILVLLLFYASYRKGPEPKWRWGKKSSDNPNEDY